MPEASARWLARLGSSFGSVLHAHVLLDASRDRRPASTLGLPRERVGGDDRSACLALQLRVGIEAVGGEAAVVQRGANGAPRLGTMLAVAEPAARGHALDIIEGGRDAVAVEDA